MYDYATMWKCKDGTFIPIIEMTTLRIKNAIKHLRRGGVGGSLQKLEDEYRKRKFKKMERKCPFCKGGLMTVMKLYDDSSSWLEYCYRLTCECGAEGPKINIYTL